MGVLVEADELAALLAAGRVGGDRPGDLPVLLDVRWTLGGGSCRPDYLAGHLPGARWVELETDLSDDRRGGGRHPLPSPADFEQAMRRVGVHNDSTVIVYDAVNALAAARLWWMLTDAGLPGVRVLNGGYTAWTTAGQPIETGPARPFDPGDFIARPGQLPAIDAVGLAARIAGGDPPPIIDVRAAERYSGRSEPIDPVAGHIPGAVNVPSMINIGADGRFLPAARIADHYPDGATGSGTGEADRPVVYCGSGITAAHTALARAAAGLPVPVIYPGSWSDWITDPARPVATGEQA